MGSIPPVSETDVLAADAEAAVGHLLDLAAEMGVEVSLQRNPQMSEVQSDMSLYNGHPRIEIVGDWGPHNPGGSVLLFRVLCYRLAHAELYMRSGNPIGPSSIESLFDRTAQAISHAQRLAQDMGASALFDQSYQESLHLLIAQERDIYTAIARTLNLDTYDMDIVDRIFQQVMSNKIQVLPQSPPESWGERLALLEQMLNVNPAELIRQVKWPSVCGRIRGGKSSHMANMEVVSTPLGVTHPEEGLSWLHSIFARHPPITDEIPIDYATWDPPLLAQLDHSDIPILFLWAGDAAGVGKFIRVVHALSIRHRPKDRLVMSWYVAEDKARTEYVVVLDYEAATTSEATDHIVLGYTHVRGADASQYAESALRLYINGFIPEVPVHQIPADRLRAEVDGLLAHRVVGGAIRRMVKIIRDW